MIAECHDIEADAVHELGRVIALVGGVEQRALELVACIKHDDIAAILGQSGASLIDLGLDPGNAAETLVLALFFGRAGGIILLIGSMRECWSLICRIFSV